MLGVRVKGYRVSGFWLGARLQEDGDVRKVIIVVDDKLEVGAALVPVVGHLGFRVRGLRFRAWGLGFWVLGSKVKGSGLRVWDS
jgi:hypothetical protein